MCYHYTNIIESDIKTVSSYDSYINSNYQKVHIFLGELEIQLFFSVKGFGYSKIIS